jgi:hypothetical protein
VRRRKISAKIAGEAMDKANKLEASRFCLSSEVTTDNTRSTATIITDKIHCRRAKLDRYFSNSRSYFDAPNTNIGSLIKAVWITTTKTYIEKAIENTPYSKADKLFAKKTLSKKLAAAKLT